MIEYYATIRDELRQGTLKGLSESYCEIRDESGEGCSTFCPVNVFVCGTTDAIAHIPYTGRIWDQPLSNGLAAPPCLDTSTLLYDNRGADIKIPPAGLTAMAEYEQANTLERQL